jgi:hypothetical protein
MHFLLLPLFYVLCVSIFLLQFIYSVHTVVTVILCTRDSEADGKLVISFITCYTVCY